MLQAVHDPDRKMTWHDWCCMAYDNLDDNADHIRYYIDSCTVFLDCLEEQAQKIEDQKTDMLTENILSPSDIEAITTILSFHSFAGVDVGKAKKLSLDECAKARKFHCDIMHDFIGKGEVLKVANEMPVGTLFYKALEMMGEDATQYSP